MTNIKKGDKLRVIDSPDDTLPKGALVYAITDATQFAIDDADFLVSVSNTQGGNSAHSDARECIPDWLVSRFEIVETEKVIIDWSKPVETLTGTPVEILSTKGRGKY